MEERRTSLIKEIAVLDEKDVEGLVPLNEVLLSNNLKEEIWKVSKRHETFLHQKYSFKWLKEGETNSKFFHSINWQRKMNAMKWLSVNG